MGYVLWHFGIYALGFRLQVHVFSSTVLLQLGSGFKLFQSQRASRLRVEVLLRVHDVDVCGE